MVEGRLDHLGVVVSARTDSLRLPGKALLPLGGIPMVLFLLRRIAGSALTGSIILATTSLKSDDYLADLVEEAGFPVFRGDADCLISRYVQAAEEHGFTSMVRVTADCPFVDAESLDYFLKGATGAESCDLSTTKGVFPRGIDFELFTAYSLRSLLSAPGLTEDDREHLTSYYYRSSTSTVKFIDPPEEWQSLRHYTVDTPEDYYRAVETVRALGDRIDFSVGELVRL